MVSFAYAVTGVICMLIANIISSSAGIGGGSLNISILLTVFGFNFDDAAVFSLCNVCGNYVAQILVNRNRRHPLSRSRSIIDWFSVVVFAPAQLSGNTIGVIISTSIPTIILEICTVLVLAFAFGMTVRNCYQRWAKDVALNDLIASVRSNPLLQFRSKTNSAADEEQQRQQVPQVPAGQRQHQGAHYADRDTTSYKNSLEHTIIVLDNYLSKKPPVAGPNASTRASSNATGDRSNTTSTANPNNLWTWSTASGIQSAQSMEFSSERFYDDSHGLSDNQANQRQSRHNPNSQPAANHQHYSASGLFDHRGDSTLSIDDDIAVAKSNQIQYDYRIIAALVLLWSTYAAIYTVMQLATTNCSKAYYSLLGLTFLPMVCTLHWSLRYIGKQQALDSAIILQGDIDFSKFSGGPYIFLVFVIGVLSALLGIGGGELTGPLLLYLGLLPIVSSSTTSALRCLSSSSNVLHYSLRREIDGYWGLGFFVIGMVGGFFGRRMLLYLIAIYKRTSITTLALAVILFTSIWVVIFKIVTSRDKSFIFLPFCV
jgi:uncharacterized membrane protein YfcA